MKWIGQHIWDFISRYRSSVYLENISDAGSDTDKFLVAESDGKIAYRTGAEVLSDIGASSESTDLEFNGSTANGVLTYGGAAQIDVESGLTFSDLSNKILYIGIDNDALTSFQRIGHSDGAGGDLRILSGAASSGSSNNNQPGGDLSFFAGNGTGNATGSSIYFYGPQEGSSGDSAQDSNTIGRFYNNSTSGKNLRLNAANDVSADYFNIACGVNAATTITTTDAGGGTDADLTLDIDGDIVLDSATGIIKTGSTTFVNNSGVIQVATQGTIDHDSLANYAANEHFTQANIVATGTVASGTWEGTAIADTYVANDLTISGGTVNNSVIGGSTPAAITGTTIDANTNFTVGTTVITDDQIQFTPSTDDTATIAAGSSGTLNITTVDDAGRNAELNITADGIISTTSSASQINTTYDFQATTFENLMTAGKPSGKIIKYSPAADATLTAGQVYYLRDTGSWLQADADSVSTSYGLLGLGMGGSSQTVGVMIQGFMRIPTAEILNTPTNVDGQPVYLSTTAGHFDFTAPSASGDIVRVLGYAIDDHLGDVLIYFNPDRTWIEIA